jgi:hypothetical protein
MSGGDGIGNLDLDGGRLFTSRLPPEGRSVAPRRRGDLQRSARRARSVLGATIYPEV